MPSLKNWWFLNVVRDVKVYLSMEAGLTRGRVPTPGFAEPQTKKLKQANKQLGKKQQELATKKTTEGKDQKLAALENQLIGVALHDSSVRTEDRLSTFKALLGIMPPGRLLDLACGHGKFSLAAHELGWEVTAVDVRTERMPMTPGIEWVQSDVRSFEIEDKYDCISVLGLLYHLELADQLELLQKCTGTPTIVDTRVSSSPDHEERGYQGSFFEEVPGASSEQRAATTTASWDNKLSFWPTERSMIQMLHHAGFNEVFRLTPPYKPHRTFYLCL